MRVLMDGRVLAAKPSGVRDIAIGMVEGFQELDSRGLLDFMIIGSDAGRQSFFDHVIPDRFFMHAGIPLAARRLGADRIFIPRQTKPVLSPVPAVPLFHDIGFFRAADVYSKTTRIGLTTRMAATARHALAVSQFTADEMSKAGVSDRVQALPIQAIHKLAWDPNPIEKYLLCIAVQEPHKNLVRLVQAWSQAETEDFKLIICGRPGDGSEPLLSAIEASSKAQSVTVTSGLTDAQYLKLLNGCWGYIQPSLYEGLCIPALDLAAAGAPSAVSSSGNLGLVYKDAPTSQVFDPHSTTDIARSIEMLLHEDSFRATAGRWNRVNIRATDWANVARVALGGMK
ncbi:glycosyltransferase [Pseudarthrobacter sp. S9]|uniref:glycosyltransferase n=1 Tax=Pseudarthrobacter sp. S9 TaxID=3418421 RepID=UPI003D011914